jgi:peptidyl-prolyl cis-trans isomerase B (cyclophilin B)
MARESLPDSAKAQFFINTKANPDLDFKSRSLSGFGYCVFGRVVKGMDVVAKIGRVKTGTAGGMADVPLTPVVIQSAREVQ